jgi:chloramphenicol 3-O-phosphotransferase
MLPRTDDIDMFMRMVDVMNRSIAVMTEAQNNLIVDHVVIDKTWMDQCLELFRRLLYFIRRLVLSVERA